MNGERGNGNTVLLTVIGVSTLLVALVGATFAYFTATVTVESEQSVSVTTATPVGLIYTGSKLELLNAIPGDSAGLDEDTPVTFTVKNPADSTTAQSYDLDLIIDENTFVISEGKNQLVLTIAGEGATNTPNVVNGTIDLTDGLTTKGEAAVTDPDGAAATGNAAKGKSFDIVTTQRIEKGETHTYDIAIEFKDTGDVQDTNQGASFAAHIAISNAMAISN